METIDIEDLSDGGIIIDSDENVDELIEILDLPEDTNNTIAQFDDIYKENRQFGKFIEKCLQLDNYQGMLRVINKTLIPLYKNIPDDQKDSLAFKKCLYAGFQNLESDPEHKFSHVKNVCETFKQFITKKKVPFVTLEKNLKSKPNIEDIGHKRKKRRRVYSRKRLTQANALKNKLSEANVIDLDDEEFEVPIVNLDDPVNFTSEPIEIDDDKENSDSIVSSESIEDNNVLADVLVHNMEYSKEIYIEIDTNDCEIIADDNRQDNYPIPDKMLVPRNFPGSAVNSILNDSPTLQERIEKIEKEIAHYKMLITSLEEEEVTADTRHSPYIRCERYKALIVQLYKGLCRLIGEDPIKRREVRLRPANPRSQLPIKKLEECINSNIGSDGLPHFPDFNEVVFCVTEANKEGELGWSRKEIMAEARALFTYCGQALQQSRQRREWRDMTSLVKKEVDHDPADSDPGLFAKLEENKLLAKAKENEILEKFSKMGEQNDYAYNANNGENDDLDSEEDSVIDNEELEDKNVGMTTHNVITEHVSSDSQNAAINNADSINDRYSNKNVYKCEQSEDISSTTQPDIQNSNQLDPESISQGDVTTTTDDSHIGLKIISVISMAKKPDSHREILDQISKSDTSNIQVVGIEIDSTEDYTHIKNETMDASESINKSDAINNDTNESLSQPNLRNDVNTDSNKDGVHNNHNNDVHTDSNTDGVDNNHNNYNEQSKSCLVKLEDNREEIKIKEEPKSNLLNDLDELGDNFTTTIFDILDPFLVIEISSDSSSDDDAEHNSDVET